MPVLFLAGKFLLLILRTSEAYILTAYSMQLLKQMNKNTVSFYFVYILHIAQPDKSSSSQIFPTLGAVTKCHIQTESNRAKMIGLYVM